jgi:hypothetical protein
MATLFFRLQSLLEINSEMEHVEKQFKLEKLAKY